MPRPTRRWQRPAPAAQIRALRDIAKDLSSLSWGQLRDAVTSYLDLVEATVELEG